MRKTLTRHGNSYALVIDKPILELLHIQPDTPLEIATDGQTLMVSPIREGADGEEGRAKRFAEAKKSIHAKYAKTFKRLAE